MSHCSIDLNARDKDGWTAIMFACKHGRNDIFINEKCCKMRLLRFISTTVILGRFSTVARLSEKQAEARVKLKNFDNARH